MSGALTINGNDIATLQAAGAAVTTTANGNLVADFGGKQVPELDLSNCSNLTIQNAIFTNSTYGINADSCSNLTIANSTFSQTGAGILANNCQNTTVTSCHFSDMTAGYQQNGALVGDWAQFANCTGVNLTNNTATNGPGSNPEDGFNFYNTTGVPGFDQISGNTAGGSNAVGSQSGAILQLENHTSGFTVANNIFGNSPHDVICLTGANNIIIENNQLGVTGDGNPAIQLQGGAGTPVTAGNTDLIGGPPIANPVDTTPTPPVATPPDTTPTAANTQPAPPTPTDVTPPDTTPVSANTQPASPTPADVTPPDTTPTAANTQPASPTPADVTAPDTTPTSANLPPTNIDTVQHDGTASPTPADVTPPDTAPTAASIPPANIDTVQHDGAAPPTPAGVTPADTAPVAANIPPAADAPPTPADVAPTPADGAPADATAAATNHSAPSGVFLDLTDLTPDQIVALNNTLNPSETNTRNLVESHGGIHEGGFDNGLGGNFGAAGAALNGISLNTHDAAPVTAGAEALDHNATVAGSNIPLNGGTHNVDGQTIAAAPGMATPPSPSPTQANANTVGDHSTESSINAAPQVNEHDGFAHLFGSHHDHTWG